MGIGPIFIHSLFCSGNTTYLYDFFRLPHVDCWCYREPLNESLFYSAIESVDILESDLGDEKHKRNLEFENHDFYGDYSKINNTGCSFLKEFSYDHYFFIEDRFVTHYRTYFETLQDGAAGRVVFLCCRTTGRVKFFQSKIGGVHVFLWRNPWDQWWSYKKGFDTKNLLILNASKLPNFLQVIKRELDIPEFHHQDIFREYVFFNKHWLDSGGSYKLFYSLWCHAKLEAEPLCDFSISIDQLSVSSEYCAEIKGQLEKISVVGIDLPDCSLPVAIYDESDADFFLKIERDVHALLLNNGYSDAEVGSLEVLTRKRAKKVVNYNDPGKAKVADSARTRQFLLQAETKLFQSQRLLSSVEKRARKAELLLTQAENRIYGVKAAAYRDQAQVRLLNTQIEMLTASTSWRITCPLRWFSLHLTALREQGFKERIKSILRRVILAIISVVGGFVSSRPLLYRCGKSLVRRSFLDIFYRHVSAWLSVDSSLESSCTVDRLTPRSRLIFTDLKLAVDKKSGKQDS